MLWKKGNERFALLIVAVVAVFGLVMMFNNSWNDDDSFTGFAAKKAVAKAKPIRGGGPGGTPACAQWAKTPERRCNSAPRQNQILAKYTCKSDASKTSWRLETTCAAGQECSNNVCVNLCGNGRVDPAESCGTCPADIACAAGQECSNNVCVNLCGNGRVDPGETCEICRDAWCGVGQSCEGGQCVAVPILLRQFCEGNILHNQTTDQSDVAFDCSKPYARQHRNPPGDRDLPGKCVTIDESRATCGVCGKRTCFYGTHTDQARRHGSAYTTYIRPEEQCRANGQDLGVLQC